MRRRCKHDGGGHHAAFGCTTIILQLDSSRECAESRAVLLRSMPTPTIPFPRTHGQNGPPCRICGSLAELRRCTSLSSASISPPRTHRVDLRERLHRRHQDYSWTCTTLRREVRRYDRLTVIYVNEPRDGESICLGINNNNNNNNNIYLRIIIIFLWHMRNEHLLCTRANFLSLGILLLLI